MVRLNLYLIKEIRQEFLLNLFKVSEKSLSEGLLYIIKIGVSNLASDVYPNIYNQWR